MEASKGPDWKTVGILGSARGARAAPGDAIGTEHLLAGLTATKGPTREALAGAGGLPFRAPDAGEDAGDD